MEVAHPRCCGMDISKRDAKVCVRIQHGARTSSTVTTSSSPSSKILELADHLHQERVTLVVMEAAGDYWKPSYYLFAETGLTVMLVNPRQARQIPGRKTDVKDAVWLADLGAHGLLRGSFVPPKPIRDLKDLVPTRTTMIRLRGQEAQRLEKLLESAAIKLSSAISDIIDLSGRRKLEAMIAGIDDPAALAELVDGRIKATAAELAEALSSWFSDHHRFLPGVATITAERIIAEIGIDMTVFPTAAYLTSWAGVAPGANESAGIVKSSRCRPGNTYLKGALGAAALSASHTKDTFLAARDNGSPHGPGTSEPSSRSNERS